MNVNAPTSWRPTSRARGLGAWYAGDFADDTSWLHIFNEADVAEIKAALQSALATGKDVIALTRDDFPLPTVSSKLAAAVSEVEQGRGRRAGRNSERAVQDVGQLPLREWPDQDQGPDAVGDTPMLHFPVLL